MIDTYDEGRYIVGEYETEQAELLRHALSEPTFVSSPATRSQEGPPQDGCCGCEFIPEEIAVLLRRAGLKVVEA